ncbi:Similar to Sec3: Exocyst complex component 1 (Drosophila melanogaster) [Cotesia congregata]|uniref:Similar to Sec3: Exocyst complex component 1 (Drosophila melanogaster) n=1 Tax=Cotesia congregata TaxID=51543 RepID=A0A8J2HI64_COTCN|nr:Similar to Sec3: Exocyst complex component 1 (Drosophila melanogaster) [Cotesia congregata]
MYLLVRLSQHVMSAQDTGSFLSMTFASALVQVKRSFDKFMQLQQQSILKDTKVNRRNKCGILPYVANFGSFARITDKIFKNSDRKVDLEKSYTKLVATIPVMKQLNGPAVVPKRSFRCFFGALH